MLSDKLRPVIEPATSAVGRALARAHLTANGLTTIGLLGTLACAFLITVEQVRIAGLLLVIFAIVDVLDGALARATGTTSRWGAFYDAVCDRIGDNALLAAIAWYGYARAGDESGVFADGEQVAIAALVAVVTTNVVPYARAKAEAFGVTVASGPGERAERLIILIVALLVGMQGLFVGLWLIIALSAWTFIARIATVRRETYR